MHGTMKTPATPDEEIQPTIDDLIVFVDDTGHETFAGNQGYYGLGGCIVTGASYELSVKPKWRDVRQAIKGNPDASLHGSDITMDAKQETFAILQGFFELPTFIRVAVTTTKIACRHAPLCPCHGGANQNNRAICITTPGQALFIVVESSKRADPIVMRCFNAHESPHFLKGSCWPYFAAKS
jgi:hypothetical protein